MNPNFQKGGGLLPVIIQNANTSKVLMLGYMNEAAFLKTREEKIVTFFSRSKNRLWTKGETSGHYLTVQDMALDCDKDTILIQCLPQGPTCHNGTESCFNDEAPKGFIYQLEDIIEKRKSEDPNQSYVAGLFQKGINKIAQKVGEEAVEVVIEAKDENDGLFLNESADLLFHYLMLLNKKGFSLEDVEQVLHQRHEKKRAESS